MAVTWSAQAADSRERLFIELAENNPRAASMQDDAIEKLTSSLDGMATYQKLPSGAHFVTAPRYPIVVIYDRDPAGNAIVLDVVPARSNWKPSP